MEKSAVFLIYKSVSKKIAVGSWNIYQRSCCSLLNGMIRCFGNSTEYLWCKAYRRGAMLPSAEKSYEGKQGQWHWKTSETAKKAYRLTYVKIEQHTGCSKKCHVFNRMPFPQLLTETIVLRTCCFQHFSILLDKKSSQTLQWFSRPRRSINRLIEKQTIAAITSSSRPATCCSYPSLA